MALGFVFGRVVVARAYVRGSAELKKTGSPAAVPGGQALSSSALAGSAGAIGEEQAAGAEESGESGTGSPEARPREEIGPDPETTQGQPTEALPAPGEEYAPPAEEARYAVQVGAFGNEESARTAATRLTRAGYPARIEVDRQARTYRVVTGSFETEEGAQEALREILGEGFPEAFVVAR
jgi:cell division protein FtsN